MSKSIESLIAALKEAAQEEIMLRESSDTSDRWQDDATPENVLLLIEALIQSGELLEQCGNVITKMGNEISQHSVKETGLRQYIRRLEHKISNIEVKP
ncbi:hypothetical protein HRD68_16695 [Yersinia massiliensis]|jgi:hypothetical protein|uniref:hypothetical protein n=1 Tax=Yersinia massiliensis TaxID=419257 RepID=UPI00156294E2|nr:hypothetical protein [Yersinia massiliensis]QKJ12224.1 hypothetical protein HRD68_16695 [Yersinia massiliensis]